MKKYLIIIPLLFIAGISAQTEQETSYEYSLKNLKSATAPYAAKLILDNNGAKTNVSLKKGTVFTYKNRSCKKAFIAGDFSGWKKISMNRGKYGVWYYFLAEYDRKDVLRYKYLIDGIWTSDPLCDEKENDGYGSTVSKTSAQSTGENKFVTYKIINEGKKSFVEFRIFSPSASYISIVGDFNRWNPENDVLFRDDKNIWRIRKHLPKGKYRYSYVIDGEWKTDTYNPQSSANPAGRLCSLIIIK